jgi:hypothetical protein
MTDFRSAFVSWRKGLNISAADGDKLDRLTSRCNARPRLWKVLEHIVLHAYERDTKSVVVGAPNWDVIFAWVKENGPALLKVLLSALSLFILL